MNNRKTPRIRFKGFTDDWEQRKLLDCIRKITDFRGRTPKKLGMDWSESGYLALSALNVKDGYIDFSQDVHYGDKALYDMWMSGNELHEGQVLFTTEAPMGNVAQVPDNKRYILSQRTMAFDVKEDIITENFLAILLRSTVVFNTLTSLSSGGTAKGVSQKSLAGVDVQIPTNLNEQTLLADYFRHLDHLITLHQRKLEKLKIVKKAMLENCFPKNGEKVPKFRFSGFTDDWEQRKLGEIYARSGEKNDGSVGIDRNITVATMQFKDDVKVSTTEYLKTYYTFNVGDIAFEGHQSKEFRFGRFVENDIGNGIVSHIFAVFRPIVEYDLKFWKYAINNERLMQRVLSRSTKASTMMHDLVTDDFLNESFLVPTIEEQRKIGDYFSHLDHLITLHQRKLEKLKIIKKSFLEKMFV